MSGMIAGTAPDVADVERIAAIDDRVLRNLQITQCYADLAVAVRERIGASADWCTFATWASRQAGRTIRGEDLADDLERRLRRRSWLLSGLITVNRRLLRRGLFDPETRLGRVVREIHTPFDAIERASDAVASGNLKVFAEIGREFARYLASVPPRAQPDSMEFQTFVASLTPGEPPDGQDYLRHAFMHYQAQAHAADERVRAALILLANLEIGLHEQTRLQPEIARAMQAPLATAENLGERALHVLCPGARRWPSLIHRPAAAIAGAMAATIQHDLVEATCEVVTGLLMVLALPTGTVALGSNLDAPIPTIFAGPTTTPLDAFLTRYDPCAGSGSCAAKDWSNLDQRMHYIVHLFRAFATDARLFAAPFTPSQVAVFRAGRIPDGEL